MTAPKSQESTKPNPTKQKFTKPQLTKPQLTEPQLTEPQSTKPKLTMTPSKSKMQKMHDLFIQPIDRPYWLDKIWTTQKLESHADAEPITILYWFRLGYNILSKI